MSACSTEACSRKLSEALAGLICQPMVSDGFAGHDKGPCRGNDGEKMRRLGHRTFKVAMLYQHAYDDSGKRLAADLSAHALGELENSS